MQVSSKGNGNGAAIATRSGWLSSRGRIGVFVTEFRKKVLPGRVERFNWIRITTAAFSELLQSSAALIIHTGRYRYFINEADFSHGQFAKNSYLGTKDLRWDRFDELFAKELEQREEIQLGDVASSMPAKGISIPNINSDTILVFNREGEIVERQIDQKKVEGLVFDREFQAKGSIIQVPIIARNAEEAKRAMAYLYSPEVDHFELPLAGYAAHLLAGAAAPALKFLI